MGRLGGTLAAGASAVEVRASPVRLPPQKAR